LVAVTSSKLLAKKTAAAVVSKIAAKKSFVEIDEAIFRDQMRTDILAVLEDQKQEVATSLRTWHFAAIDSVALEIQREIGGLFVPVRDGL
jgi:phosphohistidine phosphatase SixA